MDQDRARSLGLTSQDIAQTLGTLLSGYTVTEYKEGIELVPVVARAIPEERLGLGSFEDLTIPTRSGAAVPISQVALVHYEFEEPILWRRNRDVVLTVRSDIAPIVQAPDVTAQIKPAIDEIAATLPPGMRIEVGGAVEESAKANAALHATNSPTPEFTSVTGARSRKSWLTGTPSACEVPKSPRTSPFA